LVCWVINHNPFFKYNLPYHAPITKPLAATILIISLLSSGCADTGSSSVDGPTAAATETQAATVRWTRWLCAMWGSKGTWEFEMDGLNEDQANAPAWVFLKEGLFPGSVPALNK
jgi:hypothetical protein